LKETRKSDDIFFLKQIRIRYHFCTGKLSEIQVINRIKMAGGMMNVGSRGGGGVQKIYFAFVFGSVVKLCSISFYNKKRKVAQFFSYYYAIWSCVVLL